MANKKVEDPQDPEKAKGTGNESSDVTIRKELYVKDQELLKKEEEIRLLKEKLEKAPSPVVTDVVPDNNAVESLKSQVEFLTRQMTGLAPNAAKLMFREPTPADLVPDGEEVTFVARSVLYVVASYRDYRGIEKLPPHKLIVFQYAASDIRKEGSEDKILNFSQYTTNLRTEIEFLRGHPFYGITFGENTNEMANEDVYEIQYKTRAATMLATMSPESIYQRAEVYKIPNWRQKSAEQLRGLIVVEMSKEFRREYEAQQKELVQRQALRQMAKKDKEE